MQRRVYKLRNSPLCGVCAGVGEYLSIDPVILRILWVLFGLTIFGTIAYFVCAMIIPYKDQIE